MPRRQIRTAAEPWACGLRIAAGLVLTDEQIEAVAAHVRLDAPIAGRAPIVERQVAIDHVGNEIGPAHGPAHHRIGGDVVAGLEVIVLTIETIAERRPGS